MEPASACVARSLRSVSICSVENLNRFPPITIKAKADNCATMSIGILGLGLVAA